jgi:hypothetical protein
MASTKRGEINAVGAFASRVRECTLAANLLCALGRPYAEPLAVAALLAVRDLPPSAYRSGIGVATLGHWARHP